VGKGRGELSLQWHLSKILHLPCLRNQRINEDTEQVAPNKTNFLNFPYSDSDGEPEKEEVHVDENIEFSMEQAPETKMFTNPEKGETTSSKRKKNKSKKIKKLKERIT
jgi:hypothetical protein